MTDAGDLATHELAPLREFLAQTLPFNTLGEAELDSALRSLVIRYHAHGDTFDATSPASGLRILRSGAVDLRDGDNKLLDRLGEGESFHIAGLNAEHDQVIATVIEDALVYLVPDTTYFALREASRHFDRYFTRQRSRRLRRAARLGSAPNLMMQEVGSVMSTALVTAPMTATALEVANIMADSRVSSAFIMDGDKPAGIVTDRDLRVRLVAAGLPVTTPITGIMTPDPDAIDAAESLFAATLRMTQRGYHHLGVTRDGELAGVITTSDLILARQDDPVYLVQHLSRETDIDAMRDLVAGSGNAMVQWVQSGMRADQVSRILTAFSDAITVHLIQLAEQRYGPAPAPWCWTAFGSQARAEQLLGADQDNGIIIANELDPGDAAWYADVARFVSDGLAHCGYRYCPGNVMATTNEWRQTLAGWQETVRHWTRSPTPDAVMRVSIFFDLRAVYGDESLCTSLQQVMLDAASTNTIFLAAVAANVLDSTPPLGIFRRFVVDRNGEHRDSLDLKKRGVLPLTEIARLHALAHQIPAVNTDERLADLAAARHLAIVDARNLADALHCIQHQRILHQCEQITRGEPVSNHLNPSDLPKMAREQLRDAFTIIDEAQSGIRQSYRAGLG